MGRPIFSLFHEARQMQSSLLLTEVMENHHPERHSDLSVGPWGSLLITWTLDRCGLAVLGECSSSLW